MPASQQQGISAITINMHAAVIGHVNTNSKKEDPRESDAEMMEIDSKRLSMLAKEIEEVEIAAEVVRNELHGVGLRKRIHYCCTDPHSSKFAHMWEMTLTTLILLSIAFYACDTFATKPVHRPGFPSPAAFAIGEIFFTIVFSLEIIIRGAVSPAYFSREPNSLDRDPPFFLDALNLLDFVSVLPWFLETIFKPPSDPTSLNLEFEIIKLLRVLRVFKIFRSFSGTAILFETASKSAKPLSLTLMMLFMFFTVVASAVFMLEPCASPDCTFKDAYNTGYFLAITLTTVGYGDQIPTHPGARMLAIITMMFGAVFLSMPIAVIGNKFELAYNNFEKKQAHKNPKLALENAKKDYQKRLEQRRHRITSGMFSMLYNFQCVEKIMGKIEKGEVAGGVADAVLREMSIIKEGSSGKQSDGGVPSKYAIKSWGDESKEGKEKPEYRKKEGSRAKVLIGPASEALSQLSRKHHFVSIDIRQLFRTNRVDTALPEHIQDLMKKITMSEDELSEDKDGKKKKAIGDGQDNGDDDDDPSHAITQSASNGVQAFDLVSSMAAKHQREAAVKQARQRGSLLDKLWLVLEVHESSRCAYRTYMARWVMLGLSVAVMMLSTWPEFHAYGEDSVYCRRLVVSYCKSIELSTSPNKDKWIAANPGCFPATALSLNVSADKDYRGCMARDTCDFPSVAHNMTCSHGVMFDGCDNHPDACSGRHDFRNSVYINLMNGVTVCERTPCVDNVNVPSWYGGRSSGDYSGVWGIMETGLVFYFVLEYVTRVVVARRPKDFFMKHKANLAFTMLLVLEFVLVITSRKDWKYDAWGFQPFDQTWDTHTMRPLRIIVPLRFVAFSSDFRGIRVAMLTLERVAGRMLTPALFFAVFMVLFAGLMYVFELLECKAMQIPDGRGNLKWFYMNSNEEDDCMVQDMFDAMWIIIVT